METGSSKLTSKPMKIWLWLSIAAAIAGAVMLFPIGGTAVNVLFVIIKAGMITGLLLLLGKNTKGFAVWILFSLGAIVMTLIKWHNTGRMTFLFILAIITDILMPAVALTYKK